jgi:hypothetical protein
MKYKITERRTGGGDEYVIRDEHNNQVWSTYNSYYAQEVIAVIEKANAPLEARIAELEAALEANKRSSFIVWDTTIHEMRGKLQSIHSTATHALKKAGGNE